MLKKEIIYTLECDGENCKQSIGIDSPKFLKSAINFTIKNGNKSIEFFKVGESIFCKECYDKIPKSKWGISSFVPEKKEKSTHFIIISIIKEIQKEKLTTTKEGIIARYKRISPTLDESLKNLNMDREIIKTISNGYINESRSYNKGYYYFVTKSGNELYKQEL